MKRWHAAAVLATLALFIGCWPAHAQSFASRAGGTTNAHIEAFMLRNAATGVALNGALSDSVAGGSSFTTSWVPIAAARLVVFGIRDSLVTAYGGCTPCTPQDTLSVAQVQFSDDTLSTHWAVVACPATYGGGVTVTNDTIRVMLSGRIANVALTLSTTQTTGYRKAEVWPYDGAAPSLAPVTSWITGARYARLAFTVATRGRGVSGAAGNAPMLGIRVRAWVYRDTDATIPRSFE